MSIARTVRLRSALVGFFFAQSLVVVVKYANARSRRTVFGSSLDERDATTTRAAAGDTSHDNERSTTAIALREGKRTWNAFVDRAFGAGVKALSDRKL